MCYHLDWSSAAQDIYDMIETENYGMLAIDCNDAVQVVITLKLIEASALWGQSTTTLP